MDEAAPATLLVIFGITGDLASRYLLPALAEIAAAKQLPTKFQILGISRQPIKPDDVLDKSQKVLAGYLQTLQMALDKPADYQTLRQKVSDYLPAKGRTSQVIFYFAVPPEGVLPIIEQLAAAKLNGQGVKLLLEKPFGRDLASAVALIKQIDKHFSKEQVYRIDHYLAKEMAQNIVVFLGSNALFRDVWNNRFIDSIEIVVAEKIGIEGRVGFYESTGALRDIIQSHGLQLAALTLMRPCADIFDFAEIPIRRLEALEQLTLADESAVVRGQYKGYQKEVGNDHSAIETFVALTLTSRDNRWRGVPIHIITGKKLDQRLTEIRVRFKKVGSAAANRLILRIQPRESIELDLWVKQPGYDRHLQQLPLKFAYGEHFAHLPDAYEMVLVDAMRSNQSLFAASQEVLTSWRILEPVLKRWSKSTADLVRYSAGSAVRQILDSATS